MESVELRAAFIVRVQIQTTNTIGFHIKSNTAIFHYILDSIFNTFRSLGYASNFVFVYFVYAITHLSFALTIYCILKRFWRVLLKSSIYYILGNLVFAAAASEH